MTLLHALIRSVLSQVLSHVASYAGCAALFGVGQAMAFTPLSVLSMIGMAFVMSFNFMALHETVHRSAFKSRMWNDVFMHVSGFFTMRPVCSSHLLSPLPQNLPQFFFNIFLPHKVSCGIIHTYAPPYIHAPCTHTGTTLFLLPLGASQIYGQPGNGQRTDPFSTWHGCQHLAWLPPVRLRPAFLVRRGAWGRNVCCACLKLHMTNGCIYSIVVWSEPSIMVTLCMCLVWCVLLCRFILPVYSCVHVLACVHAHVCQACTFVSGFYTFRTSECAITLLHPFSFLHLLIQLKKGHTCTHNMHTCAFTCTTHPRTLTDYDDDEARRRRLPRALPHRWKG